MDNILIHALFAMKSRPHAHRAMQPKTVEGHTILTHKEALNVFKIIQSEPGIDHDYSTKEECKAVAINIQHYLPRLLHKEHLSIIEQYVVKLHRLCK